MAVNLDNLLDAGAYEEGGGDSFFDAEEDPMGCRDADGGRAELDCFEGVFDLKEAAFGGEGAGRVVSGMEVGTEEWAYLMPRSVRAR